MGKILLIIAAVWLVVFLLRRKLSAPRAENPTIREVRTVRCAHCGMHVPESEAVRSQGHDFCSLEHRNLGPRS